MDSKLRPRVRNWKMRDINYFGTVLGRARASLLRTLQVAECIAHSQPGRAATYSSACNYFYFLFCNFNLTINKTIGSIINHRYQFTGCIKWSNSELTSHCECRNACTVCTLRQSLPLRSLPLRSPHTFTATPYMGIFISISYSLLHWMHLVLRPQLGTSIFLFRGAYQREWVFAVRRLRWKPLA